MPSNPIAPAVRIWLLAGVVMVFFQVVIGGVTRLTDSGLSITEWAVIQGTIPPLNEADWQAAFEQYKLAAKKQYESLHADMTLEGFKFIYFWEYGHRLWARMMGFVFLIPFLWFLAKGQLPGWLVRRLGVVIGLASLAAVFGWIMVASGLNNDNRTWVSAYKLTTHLAIATALFGYLVWTWLKTSPNHGKSPVEVALLRFGWWLTGLLLLQILLGGLMAGMRAALVHPFFPVFVEWQRFWDALTAGGAINASQAVDYEPSQGIKAVVQLLHRTTAWALVLMTLVFVQKLKARQSPGLQRGARLLLIVLSVQFLLGVMTVINSIGRVPLLLGVLHQAGALVLFGVILYLMHRFRALNSGVLKTVLKT